MEEGMRSIQFFEDIPDLIHDIQLRLSAKEAARTSVLSKSWLQNWSTIPSLRFREGGMYEVSKEVKTELLKLVNRTLIRYLRDNIPVKIIDVMIDIENQESASFAVNWIRPMATKSCLQQLSLEISLASPKKRSLAIRCRTISLTLPDEILSACLSRYGFQIARASRPSRLKTLVVFYDLAIISEYIISKNNVVLEINDVPNIRSFMFEAECTFGAECLPFNLDSLGSVTELSLSGIKIVDQTFVDILQSKFPFLEILTLHLDSWMLDTFNFTSLSLKRIYLYLSQHIKHVNIKVHAPNLVFFSFIGLIMPSLLFPTTNLELNEMKLELLLIRPVVVDESFFLKMREALTFSRKCDITIRITNVDAIMPSEINLDDLRRVTFPAINVQRLSFITLREFKGIEGHSPFFDAFFSICHPKHLAIENLKSEQNYLSKLMVREVMEKKTRKGYWGDYLKDVEIRRNPHEKWETLTNSGRSFPEGPALVPWVEFKLNWR